MQVVHEVVGEWAFALGAEAIKVEEGNGSFIWVLCMRILV